MKNASLAAIFSSAALAACASYYPHDDYAQRPLPRYLMTSLGLPLLPPRYDETPSSIGMRVSPQPGDVVIEYTDADPALRAACATAIRRPISERTIYDKSSSGTVTYDINNEGRPVNTRIISADQNLAAEVVYRDIANTRFQPPVYEGNRLFCANVSEDFYWGERESDRRRYFSGASLMFRR